MPNDAQYTPRNNAPATQESFVNRPLPQDIDAEKSTLAACMLDANAMEEIATMLRPEHFMRGQHQMIFSAMMDMVSRSIPVDQISVADNLRGKGELEAAGGKAYLLELADNTFSLANWKNHASIVKRTAVMRKLAYAAVEISGLAYDAEDNIEKVVGEAETALQKATEQVVSSDFVKMEGLVNDVFEQFQERARNKGRMVGVPTGFTDVDKNLNGLKDGDLVILAARPSVGKTAFALNMAVNAAYAKKRVAFLSLEMSNSQLAQRILCSEAKVDMQKVNSGTLDDKDWSDLVTAGSRIASLPLFVDDSPGLNLLQLRTKARRLMHDVAPNEGIIFVDYLQLMTPVTSRRDGNRAVEVSEISRGLKILAKDLHMPVVALSQLSRDIEKRPSKDKTPKLSDLRESGSIEQDADIVIFLDRSLDEKEADNEDRPGVNEARLVIAKHRNGPIGTVDLSFDGKYTKFGDAVNQGYYSDMM